MTTGAPSNLISDPPAEQASVPSPAYDLPEGYTNLRADEDIQFVPLEMKDLKPREPSAIEQLFADIFGWLAELFAPAGEFIVGVWPILKWVLLAGLVAFVLFLILRLVGPLADRRRSSNVEIEAEPEWQPDREESLALLEDADQLAAQGRYDEAAHLLLKRSVGQIASARPDWVDPSSTARELAALPRLSEAARRTFGVISEAVERSLFALKNLNREDWEKARAAYVDFALARIDAGKTAQGSAT